MSILIINKLTLRFHNIYPEFCSLSEERNSLQKKKAPQTVRAAGALSTPLICAHLVRVRAFQFYLHIACFKVQNNLQLAVLRWITILLCIAGGGVLKVTAKMYLEEKNYVWIRKTN